MQSLYMSQTADLYLGPDILGGCLADSSAVIDTNTLQVGEYALLTKTFSCPGITRLPLDHANATLIPDEGRLHSRSAIQCSQPDICQCGQTCTSNLMFTAVLSLGEFVFGSGSTTCLSIGDPVPLLGDCSRLLLLLPGMIRTSHSIFASHISHLPVQYHASTATSFVLSPGHVQSVSFATCLYAFVNESPTMPVEFCWVDLVSAVVTDPQHTLM